MAIKVCALCLFPLSTSIDGGCVPGNCQWRPTRGTREHMLWMRRREWLPEKHPLHLECAAVA
jgi:hypothetical protein